MESKYLQMLMVYGFCVLLKIMQLVPLKDIRLIVHGGFLVDSMFVCKVHEVVGSLALIS